MNKFFSNFKCDTKVYWKLCFAFCLVALIFSIPDLAVAAPAGDDEKTISNVLCRVVSLLVGKVGKGIATIAVVFLGVGLFLGKLSWGVAVATAIGIAGIFGAGQIVNWLSGGTVGETCDIT